jgi:uncharacterized protein YggT (Ycf19 family)
METAFLAQLANTALSLLMWLIVGRLALDLLVGDRPNFMSAFFHRFTDPVLRAVRAIAPRFVGDRFIPVLSVLLLVAARLLLLPLLRTSA